MSCPWIGSGKGGGAEGAYFWLPCWCSRVACFQLGAPAWHAWGSGSGQMCAVALGGARSPLGELGRSRGARARGELGRPRGSSIAPLCVGSWPGGVGLRAVAGCRCGRSRPSTPLPGGLSCLFILISSLAFCSFTAPVSLFTRFCAQQTLLSLRNEAHKEEEEDATWTEKDL